MIRLKKLCIIINPSVGLYNFYRKQYQYLHDQGYQVTGISGPGPEHEIVREMGVHTHTVSMERLPSPLKDFLSLFKIWWYLLWHRFDIVHVSTPKASLLGAIAAKLSGHRRVVYTLRGRPYENMTGWKRRMMNICERIVCRVAKIVIPNCHELGELVVKEGLCSPEKIHLIRSGSGNGVDIDRFYIDDNKKKKAKTLRLELGIPEEHLVILFVGWLRRDKGVNELIMAYSGLVGQYPNVHLLLAGHYWSADPLEHDVQSFIDDHPRCHYLPWQRDVVSLYAASDMLVLPSYREGFPNVVLEASASSLPVITTDVLGCREAVVNNNTGLIVPFQDIDALREAMITLIESPDLRHTYGQNGRKRVEQEFRQELIWEGICEQYEKLLEH